jgi:Flp pilus assembly protein TadD
VEGEFRVDLDAILANLALEEAEEELTQALDSIPLDPEVLSEMALSTDLSDRCW